VSIVEALHAERRRLQGELDKVNKAIKVLGGKASGGGGARRVLSAAARARIAQAQRERWAKVKAAKKKS